MARLLNGTSDEITGAFDATLNPSPFSVCAWVKLSAQSAGNYQAVISSRDIIASNTFGYTLYRSGEANAWSFWVGNGTTAWSKINASLPVLATWYHLLGTHDGTRMHLFIQGVEIGSGTVTSYTANAARELRMGAGQNEGTPTFFLNGSIAHAAIFSRAVTAAEAAQLFRGASPLQLGADHYWPLLGQSSAEPDAGSATPISGVLVGTTPAAGPPQMDSPSFIASWGRRPVPMITGPDTDKLLGMRGIYH